MAQSLPKERIQSLFSTYGALKQLMGAPSPTYLAASLLARSQVNAAATGKAWRPPEWAKDLGNANNSEKSNRTMVSVEDAQGSSTHYFFDAVLSADHVEDRQITTHPVQWKTAITDHSYDLPSVVMLEIGMSDAMESFTLPPVYETDVLSTGESNTVQKVVSSSFAYPVDGGGKSVNAYLAFVNLKRSGAVVKLTTRLNTYNNMLIQRIHTRDDKLTTHGLRCEITFMEIFFGQITTTEKSLYPAATHPQERNRAEAKALDDSQYVHDTSALGSIRYNRPWISSTIGF